MRLQNAAKPAFCLGQRRSAPEIGHLARHHRCKPELDKVHGYFARSRCRGRQVDQQNVLPVCCLVVRRPNNPRAGIRSSNRINNLTWSCGPVGVRVDKTEGAAHTAQVIWVNPRGLYGESTRRLGRAHIAEDSAYGRRRATRRTWVAIIPRDTSLVPGPRQQPTHAIVTRMTASFVSSAS